MKRTVITLQERIVREVEYEAFEFSTEYFDRLSISMDDTDKMQIDLAAMRNGEGPTWIKIVCAITGDVCIADWKMQTEHIILYKNMRTLRKTMTPPLDMAGWKRIHLIRFK